MKDWLTTNKRKVFMVLGLIIIVLVLPLTLVLVKQTQDLRSKAAAPDKLETEGGILSGAVQTLSDSLASGGQYIKFISSQTPTNPPNPTSPPPPTNSVTVPSSIDASGNTDVTSALNNFITGVPDGSTIVFSSGSTYLMSEGIQFKDRSNLTFYGYGSKLKLNPSAGFSQQQSLFLLGRGYGSFFGGTNRNIVIRGFEIEAFNPTPGVFSSAREQQHGVEINNSDGVEVYDILVRGVGGDGVKIGNSTNVYIHDIDVRDAGRQGVSIISGSFITIENSHFEDMGYYIFDVEPNKDTESATDIIFRNNTMGSWGPDVGVGAGFVAAGSGTAYKEMGNITISGNRFIGGSIVKNGQNVSNLLSYFNQNQHRRLYNIVFTNNTSAQTVSGPVLQFRSIDGLMVTGNSQPLSSGSLFYPIINSTNIINSPNP